VRGGRDPLTGRVWSGLCVNAPKSGRSQRSLTSTSEDLDDEDERGCQITVTVEEEEEEDHQHRGVDEGTATMVGGGSSSNSSSNGSPLKMMTLELTPPDEYRRQQRQQPTTGGGGGNRRRSITSPKLERQEAFAVNDADPAAAVRDLFLTVPDLKRDRAASMDSCFINKPTPAGKPEEVVPVSPSQLLQLPPPPVHPDAQQSSGNGNNSLRSRSVDIVLPTDQQARYKALSTNNSQSPSSSSSAVPAHKVPPDKG